MPATWQEALMLLHERGWSGELVDEACTALVEACRDGELEGRDVAGLTAAEASRVLAAPIPGVETAALCRVAGVHERADGEGSALRRALLDLDAFADALGEQ